MKNKKIIFVATRFPYPSSSGREKTLLEYLEYIKDEYEIHFYYFDKVMAESFKVNEFIIKYNIKSVHHINLPTLLSSIVKIPFYTYFLNNKSIQESIFYSKKIERFFHNEINRLEPNVIFVDMIRTAQYFVNVSSEKITTIFDMDDVISKRYEYLLSHKDSNILGYFGELLPSFISSFINNTLRNVVLKKESKSVKRRELELIKCFDKTLLVSPLEVNQLTMNYPEYKNKIYSIFPSGNISETKIVKKIPNTISFMGLLNQPHNEKGLLKFLCDVFPEIIKLKNNVHLYIIGKNPTQKLLDAIQIYSNNITLTGFLDNPDEMIMKTQVLIAPVYFGTGIKIKILEAMSLGVPIITTPVGVEGLLVENKLNVLISRNDKEYANNILDIFDNESFRDSLGKNSIAYILKHHNPNVLKRKFINLLENK